MENTSKIYTNTPIKGLVTDLHESFVSNELWTSARNAQLNSHLGQTSFIQNEPSTLECVTIPYTPIGFIKLLNNRWAVFSTNNVMSEIGIFNENECSYTKLVNANCLQFNTSNLISGVSKESFDCTETIYWTDGVNPRRSLNINKLEYKYTIADDTCETKEFTNEYDCDSILMEKLITIPKIESFLGSGGNLKNGSYQFGIAYAVNDQIVTEFNAISQPISIWTHENFGKSINLEITNLDRDFDQYQLVVIYETEGVPKYKSLGFYSTSNNIVNISNINRPEYFDLALIELLSKKPRYPVADLVVANDQYLLWGGVKTTKELNYQKLAFNIVPKYVVYQVPSDYYAKGGNKKGYDRDEIYAFGIQWLFNNGEWSSVFHIPGRRAKGEKGLASGADVYEFLSDSPDCKEPERIERWEVENTAGKAVPVPGTENCNETVIAKGDMAYWESKLLYPDNVEMFGDDACTPIRHHKFPDNCITHIYKPGGNFINILAVEFDKIEHPKDENGEYLKDIVGYRIVRGNRDGNNTIITKGIVTNVRSYKERNEEVLYTNYPFNDLREDTFISSKQTYFKNGEKSFVPLSDFKRDQFSLYSPGTHFSHTSLGEEVKFLTEEIANVEGYFEEPYQHPRQKLLTQFDLYFALIIGAIDGYYSVTGKKCTTVVGAAKHKIEVGGGTVVTPQGPNTENPSPLVLGVNAYKMEQACDDALAFTSSTTVDKKKISAAERVLRALAKAGVFAYFTLDTANKVLDIIKNFSGWEQYALQYNSVGSFNSYKCIPKDNKRRRLENYQYLYDGINTVGGVKYNNYKREKNVYLKLNDEVKVPSVIDNTRNTLEDFGIRKDPFRKVTSKASAYYVAVKNKNPNQYGNLDNVNYLDTGFFENNLKLPKSDLKTKIYKTGVIFGGDTFINKMTIKRSHHFFSQFLKNVPDGFIYDYRIFRNVGYPRYWMDSSDYSLSSAVSIRPRQSNTPRNKFNLDGDNNGLDGITVVKDKYFYLFNSGVMEFFVESPFNLDYRDWKSEKPTFYSGYNKNLSSFFRTDNIETPEEFVYDMSYSKQNTENTMYQQSLDYDPKIDSTCNQYIKNRVIYSLPAFKDQKADNWKTFLAANYYDFPMSEFGELTAMHPVDNQQIMFLFDKSSPYITVGRDELQLDGSGKKITLGDGGLFSREPRPLAHTDYYYGNSQSKWAFNNTQFGSFYPSQRQGNIFNFQGSLDDISEVGNSFWFSQYLPSKLLEDFPNYKNNDNPVNGVGLLSIYDNTSKVYYLSKRDYALKPEFKGELVYNVEKDGLYRGNEKIELTNTNFFEDASWTISYSAKDKCFVSYHDWHPDWLLQTERNFMSVKNNTIWKHNVRHDSFCNFYGKDYPFHIEMLVSNGQDNQILRSIEYQLDAGIYMNNGRDFHQILDINFDEGIISNMEQISGNLKFNLQSKKDMRQLLQFPYVNLANETIDVSYNKEEQKIRLNMFWDITKDRGEFSGNNYPLWITQSNGYVKDINSKAVDYNKREQFRKKFRNTWHRILLKKHKCEDKKLIFKFLNSKELNSFS